MFGCLRQLGCAVAGLVVLGAAGGAYATRHRWLPLVTPARREALGELAWTPLAPAGAERVRATLRRLEQVDGPVFANVSATDLAAFVLDSLVASIAAGDRPAAVSSRRDEILLRTQLRVGDLGASNVPLLGGVADRTATVIIGGTLAVDSPGSGVWQVQRIHVDAINVPDWAVPRVARELSTRLGRRGTSDRDIGFTMPSHIADVRVRDGTVTLYKNVQ